MALPVSCVLQNNLPMSFLSNERDFPGLIKWVESIPVSQQPQNYLVLAVVIKQEIEPIITKKEPQLAMQGKDLPSEITESKGFAYQKKLASIFLDPAFLPLFNSNEPLKETIVVTRTEAKVNKISKLIQFVCRFDKDKSALESFCAEAIQELNRMEDSIKGSFNVTAQALISESPCFSHLANSAEPHLLACSQDSTSQSLEKSEQPIFTLEPREMLVLKKHFDHGISEDTMTQLSVTKKGKEIVTSQKQKIVTSKFTDLRYESEESLSLLE